MSSGIRPRRTPSCAVCNTVSPTRAYTALEGTSPSFPRLSHSGVCDSVSLRVTYAMKSMGLAIFVSFTKLRQVVCVVVFGPGDTDDGVVGGKLVRHLQRDHFPPNAVRPAHFVRHELVGRHGRSVVHHDRHNVIRRNIADGADKVKSGQREI